MKQIITLSVFLLSGFTAIAQVTTIYYERKDAFQHFPELRQAHDISTKTMPQFDIEKLLKEDVIDEANGFPFRFGKNFDVNYDLTDGTWEDLGKWHVWSLKIVSPDAHSLNLFLMN